ncbi:carboxypeptidase-like regulatory domain-containing protein [Flavobacterium silvaticum]|uniref:Carboxypeptidase-like regulatory domain-containing protein n=1 Tax=Flavobacterium silvaticum TaxID=1852020 RepID=A0A972FSF7_9FLAO|nr:carboxypeptidase-like regulatory domain-containing protein [Flavobacterium silvaticum]NMH28519.1 carboxypeptidase-like regulatory domain-containing protein [Flavobacterium silvaticum]
MTKFFFALTLFLFTLFGFAQNTVKVIDASTKQSISYANISVNNSEFLISNEEGYFTVSEANSGDDAVVIVSYIGYAPQQLTMGQLKNKNLVVTLDPAVYELNEVNTSKVKPDPNAIMQEVKKNLATNYKSNGKATKNTVFLRKTDAFKPSTVDVEIDKSTGFNKTALKETNAEIQSFTSNLVKNPPLAFTDMLCNYYSGPKTKLDVVKATVLQDEKRSASLDGMEDKAAKLFLKHIDTTKYYRFKSGWFGTRDTISFRKDFNKKKAKKEPSKLENSKTSLANFMKQQNFLEGSKMEFVTNPEIYEYSYDGAMYATNNEFLYVLKFKPRKSRANYTGKLYISETDYAVVRADYELAKGKTLEGLNVKLLLGIKFSQNVSKGTVIYKQNRDGNGYYLQYATNQTGTYLYVHRPLKFIELAKEDKDVVAFDLKAEGNMVNKTEFLTISHDEVSAADVEKVEEKEFAYVTLKKYDPSIWKNYSAIEPLEEMKQFEVAE